MSAYVVGAATCILPDKSQEEFIFNCEIVSSDLKRVRIANLYPTSGIKDQAGPNFEGCEIIFPSTAEGYTITSVGKRAFRDCKAKVTLPESITEIEDEAFLGYDYDGYDFALPSKVRYIGKQAFRAAQIKGISLPSSLQNIDNAAFQYSNLHELVLPKSTFVVGSGITRGCNNLQRLEVESGCTNYSTPAGSNVIMDTKQKVVVAGCPTSKIPAEAYRIGESAFEEIKFVNETVTIPESVGVIAEDAFYWAQFKRLIIKGETVEIGEFAFSISSMERIDIYGGNVTIGESGFEGCGHLLSLWCHSHKPTLTPYKMMSEEGFWEFTGPANRQFSFIGSNVLLYAKYPEEYTDKWDDGSLIWQGWFKEVLPLPDEEKTISEVHITDFDWPVAESDCDVAATSLTKGATVSEIQYKMFNKNYGTKASLNDSIDVCFFITLDEGYTFGDAPSLYVDDKKFDLRIKTPSMTDNTLGFIFHYRVPAPPGGVPIKSVSITVPEPVEGQPLSTEVTRPTGKLYLLQGWTYSMVTWGHGADASTDSYDPTKGYTLAALVTAKEDYCFAAD
ncbi:MAG: leucine-rich repeat domain-containing protein, partial [Bacteroidales bacterium]|nr:leucine-rich repeat domain-containing protein [Bacteroidales bacterium]